MDIIILDQQEITREGMKSILKSHPDATHIFTVSDEKQLIQMLGTHPDSAVILDYTLVNLTAEQLLVMYQRFQQAQFVLFSETLSKEFARRMLFSGKRFHILLKDSTVSEVQTAFTEISHARQYVHPKLQMWINASEKPEKTALTATEKEILKAMSLGKTTKEIAAERFSSIYTVMTHRKNIFRKLDVNNAQEAIRYAVQTGIVDVMEYYI